MDWVTALAILALVSVGIVDDVTENMACDQMAPIDYGLYALASFAWATDWAQSSPWLDYHKKTPHVLEGGARVWEGNELLVQRRELRLLYTSSMLYLTKRVGECLPTAYSAPLVGLWLSYHYSTISSNNRIRQDHLGMEPVIAIGWTWTF